MLSDVIIMKYWWNCDEILRVDKLKLKLVLFVYSKKGYNLGFTSERVKVTLFTRYKKVWWTGRMVVKYDSLPKPKINDYLFSSSQQKMSKTKQELKPHTILMLVLYSKGQHIIYFRLYIIDIMPWSGEFYWFVIESLYYLDLVNVKSSKIKRRLN